MKEESEDAEEIVDGEAEEDIDQDGDDYGEEKSDCRYKIPHLVTVYITLPNGDEEVITDFEMCFTDKSTKNDADQAKEEGANRQTGQDDDPGEKDEPDVENIEFEFKLGKLVNYIKKQGYPVENSFVSYYSADFQVQINCGADPISPAISICPTDLEENQYSNELSLQLIFARSLKEDLEEVEKLQ